MKVLTSKAQKIFFFEFSPAFFRFSILCDGDLKLLDRNIVTSPDEIPLPLSDDETLRKLRIDIGDLPPDLVNSEDIFEKMEQFVPEDAGEMAGFDGIGEEEVQFDSPYDMSFGQWEARLASWNQKYEEYQVLELGCK